MTSECFDEVLNFIVDLLEKENTIYREAISSEERLSITLR